jgi:hypothetical protein
MLLQREALTRCDLVLLELVLGSEKRLHVSDEGFGGLGRHFDGFRHNRKIGARPTVGESLEPIGLGRVDHPAGQHSPQLKNPAA